MTEVEKEKERARKLSNIQKYFSYIAYFVIMSLIIFNTQFLISNWWSRFNIPPAPVPFHVLAILGLTLLSLIIILQTGLAYQLYKLREVSKANKKGT
ncbi:MAG: hypothetical protein ACTSUQ_13200 [Candidatus Freyarchaeota archaeon]